MAFVSQIPASSRTPEFNGVKNSLHMGRAHDRTSSFAMANRGQSIPERHRLDLGDLVLSEPGERVYDRDIHAWVLVRPALPPAPGPRVPPEVARPRSADRGSEWQVIDTRTGCVLWQYHAWDFDAALVEKRRLCAAVGGRSGWAYLREVIDQ